MLTFRWPHWLWLGRLRDFDLFSLGESRRPWAKRTVRRQLDKTTKNKDQLDEKFQIKWNHENCLTEDDEGDAVEPRSDVSQSPQSQAKFERIDEIFNEEQSAQLQQAGVQTSSRQVSDLMDLLWGKCHINFQVLSVSENNRLIFAPSDLNFF